MKAIETVALPGVATREVGADGVVRGVTVTAELDAAPLPAPFTARSLIETEVPLVRPLTVTGVVVPASASAHVLPLLIVNWYLVIAEPLSEPAVNAIDAEPLPGVATSDVGADGVVYGVNEDEAADAVPEPAAFTARNNTEYVVPFVRPEIVTGDVVPAAASAQDEPALIEYWYFVIAEPLFEPAVNAIDAVVLPGVATSDVGADGTVNGVNEEEAADAVPAPATFTARNFTV